MYKRQIISQETLLERFREIPGIERVRVRREERERKNDVNSPKKAGPYHNPQHTNDMAKIAMTKDLIDTEEYFDQLGLPHKPEEEPEEQPEQPEQPAAPEQEKEYEPVDEGGRPQLSRDETKRKQKRVLPRSGEPTAATIWGISAQNKISSIITPIACAHHKKKDARALSKSEVDELEYLKLCIFTGMEPFVDVTEELVHKIINNNTKPSEAFENSVAFKVKEFTRLNNKKPNTSEMKHIHASSYASVCSF